MKELPLQEGWPTPPASAPTVHLSGAPVRSLRAGTGPAQVGSTLQTSPQLPAPGLGTPPCRSALPVLTSLNTVHFPSRRGRGGPPSPAPAPPPENASVPGTRRPARCKRCGRRTIPRRGAHNHRPRDRRRARAGREVRPAAPALRAPHTSRPRAAPRVPPSLPHHSGTLPAPAPRPLRPGRSRSPEPPSSALAQEAPPVPLPGTPTAPRPLTAAQRPAAAAGGGGRRPGAQKLPDLGDPGRTPYLGGRRGGDWRSGPASERR